MSTRQTVKYQEGDFHLYTDCLDDDDGPVYLELTGVEFSAETLGNGTAQVTVTIPFEWARKLGLLL
jgi:hypothetical protein